LAKLTNDNNLLSTEITSIQQSSAQLARIGQ